MALGKHSAWTLLTVAVLAFYAPRFFNSRLPVHMDGYVAPGFAKVAKTFRANMEGGLEKGGAFSVYYKGMLVVDVWGGYADQEADVTWSRDTRGHHLTVTKVVTAIVMAMLVDRGRVHYDSPIAQYWPEFSQNGKSKISLRQLLSNQAGIPYIDTAIINETILNNPDELADILARQAPVWPPGSGHGYHPYTVDMVAEEVLRRVDQNKRNIAAFFTEEVAPQLGIDFSVGINRSDIYRVARLYPASTSRSVAQSVFSLQLWRRSLAAIFRSKSYLSKGTSNPGFDNFRGFNHYEVNELQLPFLGGVGTARSLAKLLGALANGGEYAGVPLMSERLVNEFDEIVSQGYDKSLLQDAAYGLGFMIHKNMFGQNVFGHSGVGGAAAFADPTNQLGWSYVTNYPSVYDHGSDSRYQALIDSMYICFTRLARKRG